MGSDHRPVYAEYTLTYGLPYLPSPHLYDRNHMISIPRRIAIQKLVILYDFHTLLEEKHVAIKFPFKFTVTYHSEALL